jgi:hypothetical protein
MNEDPDPGADQMRFRILKLIENWIYCGSYGKTLDVTIFYPFPDGGKMTKFDKTLGYNIVTLYEKREGNTGRAMDQQKNEVAQKNFYVKSCNLQRLEFSYVTT